MQLTSATISGIVERLFDDGIATDSATEYGEPGYSFNRSTDTNLFLIGDWWCRCGNNPHAGKRHGWGDRETTPDDLHTPQDHRPRLWAHLESQGVETDFYDEWWVDYETGKAYRTQPNSYTWQSSIQWNEDVDDYLTPDHDIDEWIAWAVNNPKRCLMRQYRGAIAEAGFEKWEPGNPRDYESGWHPGQTDDPKAVYDEICTRQVRDDGPDIDIVFVLDETSQFYVGFSAWVRQQPEE